MVCFPDANIFPEVQQAVVLLLCENSPGTQTGLFTIEYSSLEEGDYEKIQAASPWNWNSKWSHLFLSARERRCINQWWSRGRQHAAGFMNTWTLLASEITGRSYGGGVLELMPGEANKLPIPEPLEALDEIFESLDKRVRSRDMFAAVDAVDKIVLPKKMPQSDRTLLRETLNKLIQRRKTKAD